MTCIRPTCDRGARPNVYGGLCRPHYIKKMGAIGWRDAGPVVRHIKTLRAMHWTVDGIGKSAGVAGSTIVRLENGRYKRVKVATERKILAVPLVPRHHRKVTYIGTCRRLEALGWMGHSRRAIGLRLGLAAGTISRYLTAQRFPYTVMVDVADLYDELSLVPGPCNYARGRAKAMGHAPPLAWEDIDNPAERPNVDGSSGFEAFDKVAVERVLAERADGSILTATEKEHVAQVMLAGGATKYAVEQRLGVTNAQVRKWAA